MGLTAVDSSSRSVGSGRDSSSALAADGSVGSRKDGHSALAAGGSYTVDSASRSVGSGSVISPKIVDADGSLTQ